MSINIKSLSRYKREIVYITFSKYGVQQEWRLSFNNDRLLNKEAFILYGETYPLRIELKNAGMVNSLANVIELVKQITYDKRSIKIRIVNSDEVSFKSIELIKLLKINIDFDKFTGFVYFGSYTIQFDGGIVTFIRNVPKVVECTYNVQGKRHLLKFVEKIIGRLHSEIDFLNAVKALER